jgi:hypothetical protein
MNVSRHCAIWLLTLTVSLALGGVGWAQTPKPNTSGHADLYRRAVALLEQVEPSLTSGNLAAALSLVKQSNELFTGLQKESSTLLAERQLSTKDEQELAINQKLAADAQAQADRLMETAAAKKKQAQELEARGQTDAADEPLRESREGYRQSQTLSIKSALYALRNQQIIFRFLAP